MSKKRQVIIDVKKYDEIMVKEEWWCDWFPCPNCGYKIIWKNIGDN